MFETAELGQKVPKKAYKQRVPLLRESLLMAQVERRQAGIPMIVLVAGVAALPTPPGIERIDVRKGESGGPSRIEVYLKR